MGSLMGVEEDRVIMCRGMCDGVVRWGRGELSTGRMPW